MHLIKMLLVFVLFITGLYTSAQKINILAGKEKISLRGLSVVDDNIVWASGSSGTVARSTNGGKSFEWLTVKGFEQKDFRDIEAFDSNTAIIMAIAEPAVILKTTNAGKSWYKVFEDSTKGMFLDAMDFADTKNGAVIGDPINGSAYLATTKDGGDSWHQETGNTNNGELTTNILLSSGEAFFASSGTNIKLLNKDKGLTVVMGVSGGKKSSFFLGGCCMNVLPIVQGKESTGANSIDVYSRDDLAKVKNAVIVGGDFAHDKDTANNCVLVNLQDGVRFYKPETPPHGYRSCVEYITEKELITCGTSGVDISEDGGVKLAVNFYGEFSCLPESEEGQCCLFSRQRWKDCEAGLLTEDLSL